MTEPTWDDEAEARAIAESKAEDDTFERLRDERIASAGYDTLGGTA